MDRKLIGIIFSAMIFLSAFFAQAAPFRTTYQAKIIKPDGQPLQASAVNFRFTILDPAASCALYIEDYTAINMNDTGGLVAFALGAGVRSFPTSGTAATFSAVFDNSTPSFACQTPGVYLPSSIDSRKIVMQFNDGTGWQTLPAMSINAVPYSMYASKSENSIQLNGKSDTAFVEYSSLAALNCQSNEAIHFNGVSFSCIVAGGGSVTSGSVITALGYTPADGASVTALSSSLSSTNSTVSSVSSTVFSVSSTVSSLTGSVTSLQNSVAASFAAITSSQWSNTVSGISYLSGNVGIGTTTPVTRLDVAGGVRISMESATCAVSYAGTLRYNAGNVEYCNGTTWSAFGVSGAGLQSFNGSTSGTQSFANGTAGNAPAFVTANGIHTLNIPYASIGTTTAGLISNTDYQNFSNKITSSAAAIAQVLGYTPASATALGNYLVKSNNLSDLTDSSVARINLGLGTFATANTVDLGSASATGTLAIARLPSFSGDATIAAASNTIILANSGVTAGTYSKVTVDSKGRVTSGSQLLSGDVTTALGYTPAASGSFTSSQWNTSGTTINYTNGNVGIGTTTPTNTLSISGTANITGGLVIGDGTQNSAVARLDAANYAWYGWYLGGVRTAFIQSTATEYSIYSQKSGVPMTLYTSSTERVRLDANGNLGIGTTNPQRKLHLSNSGSAEFVIEDPAEAANSRIWRIQNYQSKFHFGAVDDAMTTDTKILTLQRDGNVGVGTTTPVTKLDVSGGVRISMESATCAASYAGTLRYNAGNVEFCNGTTWSAFGVSGAGLQSFNGSTSGTQSFANGTVGNAPAFVTANGVHTLNIPFASAGTTTAGLISNADYVNFNNKLSTVDLGGVSATGTLAIARMPAFTGDATIAAASNTIVLANTGVTASTYTKVTVDSKGRVTSGSQLSSGDVTTALGYTPAASGSFTSSQWNTSGTTINYVAGDVGIGTTTPAYKLSVYDSSAMTANVESGGNGTAAMFRIAGKTSGTVARSYLAGINISDSNGNYEIYDQTAGASRLYVGSTGNVGIGTTSPGSKLDVAGEIRTNDRFRSTGSVLTLQPTVDNSQWQFDGLNESLFLLTAGGNPIAKLGTQEASSQLALYAGSERVRIDASGNVGIGTTNPTAKLNLEAGSSSVAPFKFTSGTLLTSPQSGTMEYDGANFYLTDSTNTRRAIATGSSAGTIDNASNINSSGNITMTPVGSVIVSSTTASTNSSTGALVVKGGLGVAGNINTAGNLNVSGSSVIDGSLKLSSMSSGSVLFAGANGTVTQDNANFYWDGANKRLGIGTGSPAGILHVNGAGWGDQTAIQDTSAFPTSGTGGVIIDGNYSDGRHRTRLSSIDRAGGLPLYVQRSGGVANVFSNIARFGDHTQSTMEFEVFGDAAFSGNVGIGTASPGSKLEVSLAGAGSPRWNFTSAIDNPRLEAYRSTGVGSDYYGSRWEAGVGTFTFSNAPGTTIGSHVYTERFRIEGNGNVGIGTSSPAEKLDVSGRGRFSTTSAHVFKVTGVGSGYADATDGVATIYSENTAGSGGNILKLGSAFAPNTFVAKDNGNVGVGTVAPGEKLDVLGNIRVGGSDVGPNYIAFRGTTGDVPGGYSHTYIGERIHASTESSELLLFKGNDSDNGSGPDRIRMAAGNIVFDTFNSPDAINGSFEAVAGSVSLTTKMIIKGNGNVGIGTTAPTSKLSIYSGNDGSMDSVQIHGGSLSASRYGILNVHDTSEYIRLGYYNGTAMKNIFLDGSVGIGTTAPAAKLEVRSSNAGALTAFTQSTANAGILIDSDIVESTHNSGVFWKSSNDNPTKPKAGIWMYNENGPGSWLLFGTSNSYATGITNTAMAINPSGNVGIGTNFPVRSLHVNGDAYINAIVGGQNNGSGNFHLDAWSSGADRSVYLNWSSGTGGAKVGNGSSNWGPISASAFNTSSDRRLKENIKPIENPLDKILKLDAVTFTWKDATRNKMEGVRLGLIAQNVEKIFPQAVRIDRGENTLPGGTKLVTYPDLVAPLIAAIKEFYSLWWSDSKELHKTIENQNREIASVKEENVQIKSDNAKMKKENEEIKARLEKLEKALSK